VAFPRRFLFFFFPHYSLLFLCKREGNFSLLFIEFSFSLRFVVFTFAPRAGTSPVCHLYFCPCQVILVGPSISFSPLKRFRPGCQRASLLKMVDTLTGATLDLRRFEEAKPFTFFPLSALLSDLFPRLFLPPNGSFYYGSQDQCSRHFF